MATIRMDNELAKKLVRLGAWSRINQLESELRELRAWFPELNGHNGREVYDQPALLPAQMVEEPRPSGRRPMSAAAKKAISRRMKALWKARKAKAGRI